MTSTKQIIARDHAIMSSSYHRAENFSIQKLKGNYIWDAEGKKYLDANSSIWTNLHGHRHSHLNRSITRQLSKIAHSSALGLANEPASLLAEKLVRLRLLLGKLDCRLREPRFYHPKILSPQTFKV